MAGPVKTSGSGELDVNYAREQSGGTLGDRHRADTRSNINIGDKPVPTQVVDLSSVALVTTLRPGVPTCRKTKTPKWGENPPYPLVRTRV